MKHLTVILIALSLCAAAHGQQPCPDGFCPIPQAQQTHKRQKFHYSIGKFYGHKWLGSCVLVGRDGDTGYVLACEHQVDEGAPYSVSFREHGGGWKRFKAKLVGVDKSLDLAAFEFTGTTYAEPMQIHPSVPGRGQRAEILGYGGHDGGTRDGLHGKSGQFLQTDARNVTLNAIAIGGDSGGAIVTNEDGKLCGILSGTFPVVRPTASTGCGPGPIREWVKRWQAHRRGPPAPEVQPPVVEIGPPEQPAREAIDYEKLAELVAARIPKPRDGKDGRDGVDGKDAESQNVGTSEEVPTESDKPSFISRLWNAGKKGVSTFATVGELAAIVAGGGGIGAVAWWLFKRRAKKRIKDIVKGDPAKEAPIIHTPPEILPGRNRNDSYAQQLNDLYQYSGNRSTAQDATLGREYDRRVTDLMRNTSNPQLKDVLESMRDEAHLEFERIHSDRPAPVPVTH